MTRSESNDIGKFQRLPSDLRKYLEWLYYIKQKYGSVMDFVLNERLHWEQGELKPRGEPFEYDGMHYIFQLSGFRIVLIGHLLEDDLKILFNDWPYGLEKGIVHLVVWTKFDLDEDPSTGLLTDAMWKKIDDYVEVKFRSRIPSSQVSGFPASSFPLSFWPSVTNFFFTDRLVQELEVPQVHTYNRAFSRYVVSAGARIHQRNHEWRYAPSGEDLFGDDSIIDFCLGGWFDFHPR